MSVTIRLKDDIDISRGDMIVTGDCTPRVTQDIEAMVCWLSDKPLQPGGKYALKHTTRDARCVVKSVDYKVDITTLEKIEGDTNIASNDIARLTLKTTVPLCVDSYRRNRETGSLILIDEASNVTCRRRHDRLKQRDKSTFDLSTPTWCTACIVSPHRTLQPERIR
jgi:sulfate adenylyltransferase subunit 1